MRADGLEPGAEFWTAQTFDQGGFYHAVLGRTREEVLKGLGKMKSKQLVFATIPFQGRWSGHTPDVTAPDDFKAALATQDKRNYEDE